MRLVEKIRSAGLWRRFPESKYVRTQIIPIVKITFRYPMHNEFVNFGLYRQDTGYLKLEKECFLICENLC